MKIVSDTVPIEAIPPEAIYVGYFQNREDQATLREWIFYVVRAPARSFRSGQWQDLYYLTGSSIGWTARQINQNWYGDILGYNEKKWLSACLNAASRIHATLGHP